MRNDDSSGERPGLNRIGTKRDKAFALFDAVLDAPEGAGASLNLHDYDGELIAALFAWAKAREVKVERKRSDLKAAEYYIVKDRDRPYGFITIHDQRVQGWRPTDEAR